MSKHSVSLIIPMYNVEKYIEDCLDSVINQNYQHYEIIIIDDGSTDNSLIKAQKMMENSTQPFSIYQKPNGGLSDARNYGLKKAQGEYVIFIDSDDYVSKELISCSVQAAKKSNADIVCFALEEVTEENKIIRYAPANASLPLGSYKLNEEKNLISSSLPNAWNKLIKKSLFIDNDIEFPRGLWYEDLATCPKLFFFAQKITFIEDALYYYRQREGAITTTFSLKVMDIYDVLNIISAFFKEHTYENSKKDINTWYINLTVITLARLALNNEKNEKSNALKEISNIIHTHFPNSLAVFNQAFSKKRYKVFVFFIRLGFIKTVSLTIEKLVKSKMIKI